LDRPLKLGIVALSVSSIALAVLPHPARGALPARHGGQITIPAPEPITELDPARVETHFQATLAEVVYDNLYEVREDGRIDAVLAEGPPEVTGTTARVRIRAGARRHGGREVLARHVVRSLTRATSSPTASWLLGSFAVENGRPMITEVDARTIDIELARRGVRVDLLLAATPLAIVIGGNLRSRPLGTGPFFARLDGRGGVRLSIFRHAADRAPWLNGVVFTPPQARDEEIRALELGRVDAAWRGSSLYGGAPVRPVTTTRATATTPWILVPNRARTLRDGAAWGGVIASIDRGRLARVGLVPRRILAPGLPAPQLPTGSAPPGTSLRMVVREHRELELRVAESIAGMLDEHGIRLQVERVSAARYPAEVSRGQWDLRLASVRPPLPGRGPMVGAALASAGQLDRARAFAAQMWQPEVANQSARELDVMVLGHERVELHHRADLRGLRVDSLGRLTLADASFARREEPFR